MQSKFQKGEVVWAKIQGFPWWPAVVIRFINQIANFSPVTQSLTVNFIGEASHADLPFDKVEGFLERYKEFSKIKQKFLRKSIKIAKLIKKGKLAYSNHLQYFEENKEKASNNFSDLSSLTISSVESNSLKKKNSKIISNKPKSDKLDKEKEKPKIRLSEEVELSEDDNASQIEKEPTNLKDILELFKKLTICLLPSSSSEKEIIETLDLLLQNRSTINLDLKSYELIKELIKLINFFMFHKNNEISKKSSEIICWIKEKVLNDLFQIQDRNIEELFPKRERPNIIIPGQEVLIQAPNLQKNQNIEEITFQNEKSEEQICSLSQFNSSDQFFQDINIAEKENKEAVWTIFSELKDKYMGKRDSLDSSNNNSVTEKKQLVLEKDNSKVYANKLNNEQIFRIFVSYFNEHYIVKNPCEFITFLMNYQKLPDTLLGKKVNRKSKNDDFILRRRVCQKLLKVIDKIIPTTNQEVSKNIAKYIENCILIKSEDHENPKDLYKKEIILLFQKIKVKAF